MQMCGSAMPKRMRSAGSERWPDGRGTSIQLGPNRLTKLQPRQCFLGEHDVAARLSIRLPIGQPEDTFFDPLTLTLDFTDDLGRPHERKLIPDGRCDADTTANAAIIAVNATICPASGEEYFGKAGVTDRFRREN